MVDLAYGTSTFERERGNFPALPVINMFAEEVPTESKPVLQSRPGLENTAISMGTGPVKALYQIDGVLNNALFGVSGTSLYSSGTLIGAIDGSDFVSMAGYETYVFANAGAKIWGYDGTTLSALTFPDSANVSNICVGASRLIAIRADTGRFYWSDVLTTTINALSFATAENSPDKLKHCLFIGDTLILFGTETVEFWPATSDGNNPFQPLIGRVFPVGIRDTGCATEFDSTFAWITSDSQIAVSEPNNIISNPGLDAKIEASTVARLWTFRLEGVEFLGLTLDNETHVLSSRSKQWSMFESYGKTNFIPRCSVQDYFGSSLDGQLIQWSSNHSDFGGVLERRFRAGSPLNSGSVPLHNLSVRTNPGQTTFLTGEYATPIIEAKTSKDGGSTWSAWRQTSLGEQGQYRQFVQWRSLGHFSQPGLLVEFRVTDPVPFRASNVVMNEPYGAV